MRAHTRDSIAPRVARVSAGTIINWALDQVMGIHSNEGSAAGIPPKRLPMVSMGKLKIAVTRVAHPMATTVLGRYALNAMRV